MPLKRTPEQRFWSKVDPCRTDGCMLFVGYCDPQGYGRINVNGIPLLAHHFLAGKPPEGLEWDHVKERCGHRNCVWPEHLEAVTHAENLRRGNHPPQAHPTHCPRGHVYDEANTYLEGGKHFQCRHCHRLREHARRHPFNGVSTPLVQ